MSRKIHISKTLRATVTSFRQFREQPRHSLGQLFPVGMVCVSLIGSIVELVLFAVKGGFADQISALSGGLFSNLSGSFTQLTAASPVTRISSGIVTLMLAAEMLVLTVSFFIEQRRAKKVVGICLGAGLVISGISGALLSAGYGVIPLSDEGEARLLSLFDAFKNASIEEIALYLKITALVGAGLLLTFLVLMCLSGYGRMVKSSVVALLIAQVVFPIVLWCIENLIPLLAGAAALALAAGLIWIFLTCITAGLAGDGGSAPASEGSDRRKTVRSTSADANTGKGKRIDIQLSNGFWRDKGSDTGLLIPTGDCVYTKDQFGQKKFVCSVADFESGKRQIYQRGERVMSVPGCGRPKQ